jgi:hypothetical protein
MTNGLTRISRALTAFFLALAGVFNVLPQVLFRRRHAYAHIVAILVAIIVILVILIILTI